MFTLLYPRPGPFKYWKRNSRRLMYLLPILILILRPLFLQVLVRVMLLSWKRLVKVSIYWHFWFHGISSIGQKYWLGKLDIWYWIGSWLWWWTVSLAHFIPLSHPFSCIPYLVSSSKSTLLTPSPLPFVAHLLAFWPSLSHSETALSLFTSTAVSTVAGVNDQQYWATESLSNYSYGKSIERT